MGISSTSCRVMVMLPLASLHKACSRLSAVSLISNSSSAVAGPDILNLTGIEPAGRFDRRPHFFTGGAHSADLAQLIRHANRVLMHIIIVCGKSPKLGRN